MVWSIIALVYACVLIFVWALCVAAKTGDKLPDAGRMVAERDQTIDALRKIRPALVDAGVDDQPETWLSANTVTARKSVATR